MSFENIRICGAKKRLKNETCEAPAMRFSNRCRLHGGKSPKGFAHPRFKNGLYSKYDYLPPLDGRLDPKDFIQMVATVFNIVTSHVDLETAQAIQKDIEEYYQRLARAGVRFDK